MRLNQVTVASRQVARTAAFYEKLGLEPIVEDLPHYVRFLCPRGGATLSIRLDPDHAGPGGMTISFESDDIEGWIAALEAQGVTVERGLADRPWLWPEARLCDPDGNRVCLFSAGTDRTDPPGRLRRG